LRHSNIENQMNKIIDLIHQIASSKKVINEILQDEEFDYFAIQKKAETDNKVAKLKDLSVTGVNISGVLKNARPVNSKRSFEFLTPDFANAADGFAGQGKVFLLTNNDIGPNLLQYIDFYKRHPDSIFVIWDWDPQHWTYMSCMLAMHCDFYISSASENAFLFSHFNPYILGPVLGGVNQWTRRFLMEHFSMLLTERSNEPIGKHAFYQAFPKRNRAVQTVSNTFPQVGFSDNKYQSLSDLENLKEWVGHKTHWTMPVLCGVPVRVHNAIITGGIPIVPSYYKNIPEIMSLGDLPLYYETIDLIEPRRINELAVNKFDQGGESGLIERVCLGIEKHHIDFRCEEIFILLEDKLMKIANNSREHHFGYMGH